MVKAVTRIDDDQLRSRVDKLENALQSAIERSQPHIPPVKTNMSTDQADHHQGTNEIWSSNRSWSPGRQGDAYGSKHPNYGRGKGSLDQHQWSRTEEYQPVPHPPKSYLNAIHMPPYQRGYQSYQQYPILQEYEPNQPVYQPSHPIHYPSFQNHLHLPWTSYCEDHLPEWPGENRQDQNPQSYQSQFYPSQNQFHPHHQQDFDRFLNLNQHARSIEEKIEELITSQQIMRSCLKSNDEMALEVQNAHDEHKTSIDKMIKQASQLADSIREIQGNKVRIMSNERELDEAHASEITEGLEASSDEPKSEIPPEKHGEVRDVDQDSYG